ncbi:PTTG1IP isoform 4 [Pan troglodytes]|uniref:PTTG1 interacting protein n=2 Tax=Pan troglodytes TaxID=9598 RepID=A0A2I3S9V9_PANTR|nr:PTTG1IP isoform 4 [Pan troglodytes]
MGQAVSCVLGRLQPVKCTGARHVGRRGLRKQTSRECLWCNANKACLDYPVTSVLPPASLCKLSSARWGVCWVNFEALIITMSVVGGTLLLGIVICCCCCCRRKRSRKPDRSEEKAMREREERRIRQEERRAEMKTRHDEIRKKYGLFKEENPYARFENN